MPITGFAMVELVIRDAVGYGLARRIEQTALKCGKSR